MDFKIILWDIDGTLLNFSLAEKNSIKNAFMSFGLGECGDDTAALYSKINDKYWKMLEKGELTRSEALKGRFDELFSVLNINGVDSREFSNLYESGVANTIEFNKNARETVAALKGKVKQYAVTNGSSSIQRVKLEKSGLDSLLDGSFISDEIGFNKPDKRFFDFVLNSLESQRKNEVLLVGDSLSSDIRGANNAGIKCCLYNPEGKIYDTELKIEYIIDDIADVKGIVSGIL